MALGIGLGLSCGRQVAAPSLASLAGLAGWWAADSGVTQSGTVSAWNDASGNANHWTQATSARRPGYSSSGGPNGLPALTFTASSTQWMGQTGIALTGDFTVFALCKPYANNTDRILLGDRGTGYFLMDLYNPSQTHLWYNTGEGTQHNSLSPLIDGCWQVLCVKRTGTSLEMWRDGQQIWNTTTWPAVTTNTVTVANLGAMNDGSAPFQGSVSECVVCNTALSDADMGKVWNYFAARAVIGCQAPRVILASDPGGPYGGYWLSPGAVQLANKDVLVVSRNGNNQITAGAVFLTRSTDGGKNFTAPVQTWTADGTRVIGYSRTDKGPTQLASGVLLQPIDSETNLGVTTGAWVSKSSDNGVTWDGPLDWSEIPLDPAYDYVYAFGPIVEATPGGTLYLTCYGNPSGQSYSDALLYSSADHGATWTKKSVIAAGDATIDPNEAALAIRQDGTLVAIFRVDNSTGGHQGLWSTTSTDGGTTWAAPTQLALVFGGGYATSGPGLIKLASGHWVLSWGSRQLGAQIGMFASLSADEGATWSPWPYGYDTRSMNNTTSDIGYPAMLELNPNVITSVYYDLPSDDFVPDTAHTSIWQKSFGLRSVAPSQPPVASFTASPASGAAPLSVTFTDTSTGPVSSWLWDFGDGGNSSSQNPSHTFNAPGSYTVTLTVTNLDGSDNTTHSVLANAGPTTLVLDHYTDTDGTSLASHTPDTGTAPTVQHGTITVQGNKAQCSSGSGAPGDVATYDCAVSDYTVSALVTCPTGADGGIAVRYASAHFYFFQVQRSSGGTAYLYYYDGSYHLLGTASSFTADGSAHTVSVVVSGTTLTCKIDGTTQITYASATNNQTSTLVGIRGDGATTSWDDFTIVG